MNDEEIVEDVLQEREESESKNAVTPSQACAAFDTALLVEVQRQHTPCTSYAGKKLERQCSSASLEIYEAN